jgi:Ca2+-binding RTX toxin-like protein
MLGLTAGLVASVTSASAASSFGPAMSTGRASFGLVELDSGNILALGGITPADLYDEEVELLDASLTAWSPAASMPTAHRYVTHFLVLSTGEVLAVGDHDDPLEPKAHLYDEGSDSWSETDNEPSERRFQAELTELLDGRVLYSGGYGGGGDSPTFDSAELYDPTTKLWTDTAGSMAEVRVGHGAVRLTSGPHIGDVLVCGGFERATLLTTDTCERYDVSDDAFYSAPSMHEPRGHYTLTPLPDGRVLAAGGQEVFDPTNRDSAEIFDPTVGADGTWTVLPDMATPRGRHSATLLPGGRVLVAGGATVSGFDDATASVEIFNPGTDTWLPSADLLEARGNHAALALPNGRILIAGGTGDDITDLISSTEIYKLDACASAPTVAGLIGTAGDDVIHGTNGDDVIVGGGGNDIVCAMKGDDDVTTGAGDDLIDLGPGHDVADAGDGANHVLGGQGADNITTGAGDDTVDGGQSTNTVDAGEGQNVVIGGTGKDTITTGSGDDVILAGNGTNIVQAGDGANSIAGGDNKDVVTSGSGDDDIDVGDGPNTVTAGDGTNTVVGGAGSDNVTTGSGADFVDAGGGKNKIVAGDGDDEVHIDVDALKDTIKGGPDTDTCVGWVDPPDIVKDCEL